MSDMKLLLSSQSTCLCCRRTDSGSAVQLCNECNAMNKHYQMIVDNVIQIPYYSLIRKDRPHRAGGGILVYISDRVTYKRRFDLEDHDIESVWIQVCIQNHRPANMLKPQDVNVIWKDGIVPTYNLKQMVQVATRVTNESATLIDHIYASKEQLICELNVPEIGLSDHFAVCCTIKTKINQAFKGHKDINYRSDHKLNLVSFLQDLNEIDWSLCRDKNVNRAISYFNHKFLNTMNRHAPMKHKLVKYEIQPVWFSSEIKEAIVKRNKCKKNKDTENYRIWRNQVVKLIKQGKSNYYKHAIIDSKGNTSKMWRYMSDMIGKKRTPSPNTLQIGEEMITDQHEVVEQFNQHFANVADRLLSGIPLVDYSPPDLLLGHVMSKLPHGTKFVCNVTYILILTSFYCNFIIYAL